MVKYIFFLSFISTQCGEETKALKQIENGSFYAQEEKKVDIIINSQPKNLKNIEEKNDCDSPGCPQITVIAAVFAYEKCIAFPCLLALIC